MGNILKVENLNVQFRTAKSKLKAIRDVSFTLDKGETLCIVGESGCGKSITSLSVMGLIPKNGEISSGSIQLNGEELVGKSEEQLEKIRGNQMSMIFQEPMTALNPTFTIGFQLREPLMIHKKLSKRDATLKSIELLERVGIPSPKEALVMYPHELSGGMRQRVMIAIALSCGPSVLLADEPTTALDVTVQSQTLDLIQELKDDMGMGVVFVTHDMGVVAEIADRVMVMYAGKLVEIGTVEDIFFDPQHPYTKGLLGAVPNVDDETYNLNVIPGSMPNLDEHISGCRFHPRCEYAMDICKTKSPSTFQVSKTHKSACWLQEEKVHGKQPTTT